MSIDEWSKIKSFPSQFELALSSCRTEPPIVAALKRNLPLEAERATSTSSCSWYFLPTDLRVFRASADFDAATVVGA